MALWRRKSDEQEPGRAAVVVVSLGGREGLLPEFSHPLKEGDNIVGRADTCTIQLVDGEISRQHMRLRLEPEGGRCLVSDMKSANGTAVNGVRLGPAEQVLEEGDVIELGLTRLVFTRQRFKDHASALRQFRSQTQRFKNTLRQ
jgi:pSer/pThr/pTyr-binding forkhead associated (FHA) protein